MKRRKLVNVASTAERRIYGVHAVGEWLRVRPDHVQAVHYDARAGSRLAPLVASAGAHGIGAQAAEVSTLAALAGTPHHQGVVASTLPFPYAELDEVVRATPRLVVLADQMQDPHNLGALLRTADAGGAGAVIVPKDGSVPVTPTVEAVAAGAAARVPVCRVVNAARTIGTLKEAGYWAVGLVPHNGTDLYRWEPVPPLVLVVGGESGLRRLVAEHCDHRVSIPMVGACESLNASVASAVVIFELLRRWRTA